VKATLPSPALFGRNLARLSVSVLFGAGVTLVAGAAGAQGQAPPGSAAAAMAADPTSPQPTPAPDGQDPAPVVAPPVAPQPAPASSAPPPPLAPTPLGKPIIDLSVPEPTPSVVRKVHNHDGFYLRASVGGGWSSAFVATDAQDHPNYTVNGAGISLNLLVGGTPSPSLALGGGGMLMTISDPKVHIDHDIEVGSGSGLMFMVGPFVDGFPIANGGLHFGGLLGLAGAVAKRQGSEDDFSGRGFGAAAWVGQGFWVGDEASCGGLLKFDAAFLRDGSGPIALADSVYGISLLFTVLYH
jgi:hypothetical protein